MSNAPLFGQTMISHINQLVQTLSDLNTDQARLADEPALAQSVVTALATQRPDLTAAIITNAAAAINQILFTYNSGSPTQAAQLYKML